MREHPGGIYIKISTATPKQSPLGRVTNKYGQGRAAKPGYFLDEADSPTRKPHSNIRQLYG